MSRESEGKRGWSGHRGRKPSSSEAGESFQGGNRERNERATFDLSPKRLCKRTTALGTFAQISRVIALLNRTTIALLAVGLIASIILNDAIASAFAEEGSVAPTPPDQKDRNISLGQNFGVTPPFVKIVR